MLVPCVVLVGSTALFFFYLQVTCEKALRREFAHPYFQDIIQAVHLEFPRLSAEMADASVEYSRTTSVLKCDFIILTYLLKKSGPASRCLTPAERALMLYFRVLLFSISVLHAFRMCQKPAVEKMTVILQYFANLAGETLGIRSALQTATDLQP